MRREPLRSPLVERFSNFALVMCKSLGVFVVVSLRGGLSSD